MLVFAGASALWHAPALMAGRIPIQDDVRIFYFPLLVATADALNAGQLPLWTPAIFGGYPLFADGEAGMLYPFHLLLKVMSPEAALVALRLLHSFLGAAFTYGLVRALGCGALGGIIGGLAYAYSGFAAGQIVHSNVFHAMMWLPLQLLLAERAWRASGAARARYAILCGAIFGVQALAVHVHVTLMSALAVSAYVVYRAARAGEASQKGAGRWVPWAASLRQAGGAAVIVACIGAVGVGLAAVQLLPLAELGLHNHRGRGLDEASAAVNSVWPANLATLLLPRLYDTATWDYWGPWVKWETVLYVGVLPMVLAVVGLVLAHRPHRLFFGGLGALALFVALGAYAPLPLWSALYDLPGFDVLQSPGRFVLLFSLATAVLAGYGADHLAGRSGPARRAAFATGVAALAVCLGLAFALDRASAAAMDLAARGSWLFEEYLRVPGVPTSVDGAPLTMQSLGHLAGRALAIANTSTAWQLTLLLASGILLAVWLLAPRSRLVGGGAVAVLFADLWVAGLTFHPMGAIPNLRPSVPSALLEATGEPFRIYTPPPVGPKQLHIEPNRLLVYGIQEANGYSSLPADRHSAYVRAIEYSDNHLLDLWNVRYVVERRPGTALPSYGGTSFHPDRPLFTGRSGTPGSGGSLLPDGGPVLGQEVRIISVLWEALAVPEGQPVAIVSLEAEDGTLQRLPLRAGQEVSDGGLDAPGRSTAASHGRAEVAYRYDDDVQSRGPRKQLYYARLPLSSATRVKRLSLEKAGEVGRLEVYGVGVVDARTGGVIQARQKRPLIYSDGRVHIYENRSALPRAFLVGTASFANAGDVLARMLHGPFDPRREVLLDGPIPAGGALPTSGPGGAAPLGAATIDHYGNEEVVISTRSDRDALLVLTDAYFPGWVARLDGRPATMLRANYLFRAVQVPAGTHRVTFAYQPWWVGAGAALTVVTWFAVAAALLAPLAWAAGRRLVSARSTGGRQPALAGAPAEVYPLRSGPRSDSSAPTRS